MTDLGYAAAVFPRYILIISGRLDQVYVISAADDGQEIFDQVAGYIAQEAPIETIDAWLTQNVTYEA